MSMKMIENILLSGCGINYVNFLFLFCSLKWLVWPKSESKTKIGIQQTRCQDWHLVFTSSDLTKIHTSYNSYQQIQMRYRVHKCNLRFWVFKNFLQLRNSTTDFQSSKCLPGSFPQPSPICSESQVIDKKASGSFQEEILRGVRTPCSS